MVVTKYEDSSLNPQKPCKRQDVVASWSNLVSQTSQMVDFRPVKDSVLNTEVEELGVIANTFNSSTKEAKTDRSL